MRSVNVDEMLEMMDEDGIERSEVERIPGGLFGQSDNSLVWRKDGLVYELACTDDDATGQVYTEQEVM